MKLAILGTGRMGQALAGRLLDTGHTVTLWNRTAGKAPELVRRGAQEAASIAEAVADVELAISILANDDAVRTVALGDAGVRQSLPEGATYVDASTVSPTTATALAEAMPRYPAMPVLGAPQLVSSGGATYLIGADDVAAEAVAPLFPSLSEKHLRYPRPSLAAAAKLSVNLMLLNGVVALAEAFGAGRAGGLSDDQLRELLSDSPMVAPGLANRFEGILTGSQDPWWSVGLGAKDAGLVVDLARSGGVELPLTATAQQQLARTAEQSQDGDIAAVTELYRTG